MDDHELFKDMQRLAAQAGDLIAVVAAQASVQGLTAPGLLTDAAWELWLLARLPAESKFKGLPWPHTFVPTAGSSEMERRRFLAGVVATAGAVISETSLRPPTSDTLTKLRGITEQLRAIRAGGGARVSLGPTLRHVQALGTAAKAATDDDLKRELLVAHGDALTLLAWLSSTAGLPSQARRAATAAVKAANEAGHGELAAYGFGILALFQGHHLNDPHGGLKLIDSGLDHVKGASWKTRAWLGANLAEMLSMLGNRPRTMAALDEAHILMEGAVNPPPWLGPNGSLADVDGYHGACAVRLGDANEALMILQQTIRRRGGPTSPRVGNTLVDLGGAYALGREPEAACTVLGSALDRVEEQRSVALFERLGGVRPLLDPWASELFVRELDERIAATATAL